MRLTEKRTIHPSCKINGELENREYIYIKDKNLAEKKLFELEDIEDEIGVGLSVLLKQPYCTIFIKKDYGENYKDVIEEHTLYSIIPQEKCIVVTFETIKFYWKDYGKTWALTKEELL